MLLLCLYQLCFIVFLPLYLFVLWRQGNVGSLAQRLGILSIPTDTKILWLHGASVGEVLSFLPLIDTYHGAYPHRRMLITTNTRNGYEIMERTLTAAQKKFISLCYLPIDVVPVLMQVFLRNHFSALIIAEAERWPMLCALAHYRGVLVIGFNARLRSKATTTWWRRLFYRALYRHFDTIYSQMAPTYQGLSLPNVTITPMASPKALRVIHAQNALTFKPHPSIATLLVGSVYVDEIPYYLEMRNQLQQAGIPSHLLLVARHFAHEEEMLRLINARGERISHWSAKKGATVEQVLREIPNALAASNISLVCVMGTLFNLHQYATVFYLGGTFNAVGGHNVLEAAAFALPILSGPHLASDNQEALALELHDGLHRCASASKLAAQTIELLSNKAEYTRRSNANREWVTTRASIFDQQLSAICHTIERSKSS